MRVVIAVALPATFAALCMFLAYEVTLFFLIPMLFGLADAKARLSEYLRLRGRVSQRVLYGMRTSMCQRLAAIAASHDMKASYNYYRSLGYRWWNILPDGTFSIKNNCYLKKKFYMNLLGIGGKNG